MFNKSKKPLMKLSLETKELINSGIYSLYQIETVREFPEAKFVLYTSTGDLSLLEEDGSKISARVKAEALKIIDSVKFPDLQSSFNKAVNSF